MKWTGFQERYKIADVWEDDVYVITDHPHKDIPMYTIQNQTDETIKIVPCNLLLPLPTMLDWMRPFDLETLIKPAYDGNDTNEAELDHEKESDDDFDGDSDFSNDNLFVFTLDFGERHQNLLVTMIQIMLIIDQM